MLIAACVACTGPSKGADLDPYLCAQEDVGEAYQELTRGNFSPRDLADLGPDTDRREAEFRAAGMERGRFVFYKQSLPKPPFEPPINVLCQVLEFESEDAALAFVVAMEPPENVATTAIVWIPEENRRVSYHFETGYLANRTFVRYFEVSAGRGETAIGAWFKTRNLGRFVITMGSGRSRERATQAERSILGGIEERWALRVGAFHEREK